MHATPDISEVKTRLIAPFGQAKGRIRKTTSILTLTAFFDECGETWTGRDLDAVNRSFSLRYPGVVKLLPVVGQHGITNQVVKILKASTSGAHSTVVADTGSGMAPMILETLERLQFFRIAKEAGARLTVLVYAIDDRDAIRELTDAMQVIGNEADYLVVRSPGFYPCSWYDGSPLQKTLLSNGAKEITLPTLMPSTIEAILRAEMACGQALTFPNALNHLKGFEWADLDFYLKNSAAEFHRVAEIILPTARAAKLKALAAETPVAKKSLGSLDYNLGE